MIRASNHNASFRTEFTNGRMTSTADLLAAKGGTGDGFGPHDLLEAALATCMVLTARTYVSEHHLPLGSAHCEVSIDRSVAGTVTFNYRLLHEGSITPSQERDILDAISRVPSLKVSPGQ